MIDRIVGILGLALTLVFWGLPQLGVSVPPWAVTGGTAGGILLVGLAAGLFLPSGRTQAPKFSPKARLQLHVYADERMPSRITADNIWRWYTLRTLIKGLAPSGQEHDVVNLTTLFVTFDTPVFVGTLTVSSPDVRLPIHEVKEFNPRFAIIVFSGQIPEGTLEISAHQ
jgi:hypothetical protein